MSYEFSGNAASQTSANPDGTSVVSTWMLNRGPGLTQTDQLRLANGDIAATSVTDSKATQTLSMSEAGLVIAQPRGGDPTLIPAGTAASTGATGATALLEEAGPIMTYIERWFMTGAGAGAAFYFGATTPAGPEDETTPVGAAADWASGKLNTDNFR